MPAIKRNLLMAFPTISLCVAELFMFWFQIFYFTFSVYSTRHSCIGSNFFFLLFGLHGLDLDSLSDVDDLTTMFAVAGG